MTSPVDGIVVRVGATALVGMLALQACLLAIMIWPDGRPAMLRLAPPNEAGAIVRAVNNAPGEVRPIVVEALNTSRQIVTVLPGSARLPADRPPASRRAAAALDAYRPALGGRDYVIEHLPRRAWSSVLQGQVGAPGSMRLLVRLDSGEVLAIQRAPVILQTMFSRLLVIAGAGGLVLLAMTGLFYLQVVRPIDRLARGTATFRVDGQGPDLPEGGPAEVRRLAGCLNDMRRRIRELVDGRTRELAAIAHDLRTYLTRLRLRVEFIDDADERRAAILDLDEMGQLLDDTLLFASRVHDGSPVSAADIDLHAELDQMAAMRREIGQDVSVVTAPAGDARVSCEPMALRRILANLVDNAVRYGEAAHLSLEPEAAFVRLVVEDDGPGVPSEALARLTEPFHRLEPSRGRHTGGAGLGLAIVRSLAESQGGALEIAPGAARGLRVAVRLPRPPAVTD